MVVAVVVVVNIMRVLFVVGCVVNYWLWSNGSKLDILSRTDTHCWCDVFVWFCLSNVEWLKLTLFIATTITTITPALYIYLQHQIP